MAVETTEVNEEIENPDEVTEEQETETDDDGGGEPEHTELESLALDMGWVPEEKYNGDPEKWTDAKTFLKNATTIEKKQRVTIERLENEMKEMKGDFKKSLDFQKKLHQQDLQTQRDELMTKKREAIVEADLETVDKIDKKLKDIDDAERESDESASTDVEPELEKVYNDWLDSNSWYDDDKALRRKADLISKGLSADLQDELARSPVIGYKKLLQSVSDEMADTIEQKKALKKAPTTTTTTETISGKQHKTNSNIKKHTTADLSEEERRIGQRFIDQGLFKNMDEYLDSLVETSKGVK